MLHLIARNWWMVFLRRLVRGPFRNPGIRVARNHAGVVNSGLRVLCDFRWNNRNCRRILGRLQELVANDPGWGSQHRRRNPDIRLARRYGAGAFDAHRGMGHRSRRGGNHGGHPASRYGSKRVDAHPWRPLLDHLRRRPGRSSRRGRFGGALDHRFLCDHLRSFGHRSVPQTSVAHSTARASRWRDPGRSLISIRREYR